MPASQRQRKEIIHPCVLRAFAVKNLPFVFNRFELADPVWAGKAELSQEMEVRAMITMNDYFDGRIKSLGFERKGVGYTAGVLMPGDYTIPTDKEEHITATIGEFEIRAPGSDWKTLRVGDTIVVPANVDFELRLEEPASYICRYR